MLQTNSICVDVNVEKAFSVEFYSRLCNAWSLSISRKRNWDLELQTSYWKCRNLASRRFKNTCEWSWFLIQEMKDIVMNALDQKCMLRISDECICKNEIRLQKWMLIVRSALLQNSHVHLFLFLKFLLRILIDVSTFSISHDEIHSTHLVLIYHAQTSVVMQMIHSTSC